MINQLRTQQEKLLITERHEAWGNLARKLAHEIKNPLTPIQLTIDRLKDKYSKNMNTEEKKNYKDYLGIINKQIKIIENLVNQFSDFARMPKPILKDNNLALIINENVKLLYELDNKIKINFNTNEKNIIFNSDYEQLSRVVFNLLKNAIESIQEKAVKIINYRGIINIQLYDNNDEIYLVINDNGIGFAIFEDNIKNILNPYFTTKKKGTGLGLAIVNKIINDHNGSINFIPVKDGAKIEIKFIK